MMDFELPEGAMSYSERLCALADEREDERALIFVPQQGSDVVLSWRELEDRSNQMAWGLAEEGIGYGDRVGIRIRNTPDHILLALAIWKVGAVPIPVRWDLPDWELERVLGVLDPKILVDPEHRVITGTLEHSTDQLDDVMSPHSSGILSSGSTGTPKVIMRLTPGLWVPDSSSNQLVEDYGPLGEQLVLVPAPLYHSNGFMCTGNLLSGDMILLLERFDVDRLLEAIEKHGVTGMVTTTVMLQRLAREPAFDTRDLSSLDWVMHGAAPLPDWLARRWIERIGAEHFFVCYGSSEGAGATFARGDEYLDHPGTVGRGAMATEVQILDDDGNVLPQGEVGHIYMRSEYGVMSSYVGDVEPIPVTDDGFATVGDLGWLDEDGYLFLADRRVDLIISGGANIYPAEVEAAISEHPAVEDVVVIGLSDPEWGRRVHAIVQCLDGEVVDSDALRDHVGQRVARYKVPKTIEFVDEIPRSEAFKVSRAALIDAREGDNP